MKPTKYFLRLKYDVKRCWNEHVSPLPPPSPRPKERTTSSKEHNNKMLNERMFGNDLHSVEELDSFLYAWINWCNLHLCAVYRRLCYGFLRRLKWAINSNDRNYIAQTACVDCYSYDVIVLRKILRFPASRICALAWINTCKYVGTRLTGMLYQRYSY